MRNERCKALHRCGEQYFSAFLFIFAQIIRVIQSLSLDTTTMSHSRRRSVSSSSSSSSSDDEHHHERKYKKDRSKKEHHSPIPHAAPAIPSFPPAFQRDVEPQTYFPSMSSPGFPSPSGPPPQYGAHDQQFMSMPGEQHFTPPSGPPPFPSGPGPFSGHDEARGRTLAGFPSPLQHHGPSPGVLTPDRDFSRTPPPSGFRVPLTTNGAFPTSQAGEPVSYDADGHSPIFLGSALFEKSVHPCKIAPALIPPCRVPYGGRETEHEGRYDLLPFDPHTMEWVHTSDGRIPAGRRAIEGGYEDHGGKLYHALGVINGLKVPGKTGEHLVRIVFGN